MMTAARKPSQSQLGKPTAAAKAQVLTKAVLRAQELLGISQQELGEVLGLSAATVSRIRAGRSLDPQKKEFELAALFVRTFRSLDALVGGDASKARAWLRADNKHLEGAPLELMKQIQGVIRVVEYLDAMRGHV
jgi:transcriptional regulator with XRE-family HTH domain